MIQCHEIRDEFYENNKDWDLVKSSNGVKVIRCKWVLKTKKDSPDNVEGYKSRLVAKRFTQKKEIDYIKTFCHVSKMDFLHIILALAVHLTENCNI